MRYTTKCSSFHRKLPCLLTNTPYTRSKPRILSHQGISTSSTTPFLPLMNLKKATWPTFTQPSKLTFPSKMESLRKSPLAPVSLLKKSPPIEPSSKNIGIFLPGHTQKCLALIPLSFNITLTPGLTLHQFIKNNDRYTHPKKRPSKLRLTNYAWLGSSTPSPIHHGFPTLYPLTKNRAMSASAWNFAISITHVPKTTFQRLSSTKLSTNAQAMRLYPSWTVSLVIIKSKSTQLINTKPHSLPLGVLFHNVSCLLA
jgi:hypothetical protein